MTVKEQGILGVLLIVALVTVVLGAAYFVNRQEPEFKPFVSFMELLEEGAVYSVSLGSDSMIGFTLENSDNTYITNNPRREGFKEELLWFGVVVFESGAGFEGFLQVGFTIALIVGIFVILHKRNQGQRAKSGISTVAVNSQPNQVLCSFDDVAGNIEAKENIRDIVNYLQEPEKFAKYGARMPRGILFHGKPGTGKTLMARAMAGEAGVPFYAVSGSDFVQMYVGVGAARVRELFQKAREMGRGVIFIDEIDALGKKRNDGLNGNDEREQTLNALLTEMQGFANDSGIVVVAATNRPDTLDDALMRPGRFDRRVEISLPDKNARKQILELHARNKPLSPIIDLEKLAHDTVYFSGAMLEGLLNDAAIEAARNSAENIMVEHISTAYYTALAGSEKKDRSNIQKKEREITAWHEAGHALVAILTNPENRVAKVTIIPSSSGAGGFCVNIPPERMYYTKVDLRQQIMVSLAGRVAEELFFGIDNVTTGASNDIEKATKTAKQYVSKFGMGKDIVDMAVFGDDSAISRECADLVKLLYEETRVLLGDNYAVLEAISSQLLEYEALDGDEILEIIARHDLRP